MAAQFYGSIPRWQHNIKGQYPDGRTIFSQDDSTILYINNIHVFVACAFKYE